MVLYGIAFFVPNHQVALFLIYVSNEKVLKKSSQGIKIQGHLFSADPVVAHGLQYHANAMKLPVGADSASVIPSKPVLSRHVWEHTKIFLGKCS